ncbi:hypothetical protein QUF72_16855 [Desulfobacterales bacterium HSG2]|nr:hypothetical protein [Desulfobacterales bacterium HSG2]
MTNISTDYMISFVCTDFFYPALSRFKKLGFLKKPDYRAFGDHCRTGFATSSETFCPLAENIRHYGRVCKPRPVMGNFLKKTGFLGQFLKKLLASFTGNEK